MNKQFVLFEQNYQINVVAYQLFEYFGITLSQEENINVVVSSSGKVFSNDSLMFSDHIVHDENRTGEDLFRWYDRIVERVHANAVRAVDDSLQQPVLGLFQRLGVRVQVFQPESVFVSEQVRHQVGLIRDCRPTATISNREKFFFM